MLLSTAILFLAIATRPSVASVAGNYAGGAVGIVPQALQDLYSNSTSSTTSTTSTNSTIPSTSTTSTSSTMPSTSTSSRTSSTSTTSPYTSYAGSNATGPSGAGTSLSSSNNHGGGILVLLPTQPAVIGGVNVGVFAAQKYEAGSDYIGLQNVSPQMAYGGSSYGANSASYGGQLGGAIAPFRRISNEGIYSGLQPGPSGYVGSGSYGGVQSYSLQGQSNAGGAYIGLQNSQSQASYGGSSSSVIGSGSSYGGNGGFVPFYAVQPSDPSAPKPLVVNGGVYAVPQPAPSGYLSGSNSAGVGPLSQVSNGGAGSNGGIAQSGSSYSVNSPLASLYGPGPPAAGPQFYVGQQSAPSAYFSGNAGEGFFSQIPNGSVGGYGVGSYGSGSGVQNVWPQQLGTDGYGGGYFSETSFRSGDNKGHYYGGGDGDDSDSCNCCSLCDSGSHSAGGSNVGYLGPFSKL